MTTTRQRHFLSRTGRRLSFVLSPLLLLGVWEAVSRSHLYATSVLVPPEQVFQTFLGVCSDGELSQALKASLTRVLLGFVLGSGIGLMVGIALGLFSGFEQYFGLLFHFLRQVPIIAFAPLLILLFGIDEGFKVVIIASAAFFPVALNALDGMKNVPRQYRDVAEVFQFGHRSMVRKVVLPAALPSILTGLRLALSRSWMILVAAELFASSAGLGHMMDLGREMFQIDVVIVAILVTGVIGFGLDFVLSRIESHLTAWKSPAV